MDDAAAPQVKSKTRLYTIGGIVLVVLLLVAYSYVKNRRDDRLIADIRSKNVATHSKAALDLIDQGRFVDLILTQTPETRYAAIVAIQDLAKNGDDTARKKGVEALLGVSKGVDREINDPEKAVRDTEADVRKKAWIALGGIGDVGAPQLIEALKDPSGNVRAAAIEALGMIGTPAIPGLMKLMTERDTWGPAGDALAKIGQPALEPVVPLLTETEGTKKKARDLRLKMTGMLAAFDNQIVVPILIQPRYIDSRDPGVRRQVIRSLAALQDQRATLDVIRVMNEDPQVRLDAITALGEFRDPRAINALADQFNSYDFDVPASSVAALSKIGKASIPRLLIDARKPDKQIRTYATRGLATIGGPETVPQLLAASKDPVASVRAAAVSGMGSFIEGDVAKAVPILIAGFRDPSPSVSNASVVSLVEIGTNPINKPFVSQVVNPLLALFERGSRPLDAYNNQVYYAERVLSQIGAPAVDALIAAVRGGSPSVRKWAALTLGDMKTDRAVVNRSVETLRDLARSPDPEASWAARESLIKLGVSS